MGKIKSRRTRKQKKKPNIVVFLEGGIVQAVVDTNARQPQKGIGYTVVDYDIFRELVTPQDIKEYFEGRGAKVIAYMKRYLPDEYARFQEAIVEDVGLDITEEQAEQIPKLKLRQDA